FVDIGLHDSGLVHISHLANKFVRDPHDVVAVGDIVKGWVLNIDKNRRRVSLTMVQPGTERPPPAPAPKPERRRPHRPPPPRAPRRPARARGRGPPAAGPSPAGPPPEGGGRSPRRAGQEVRASPQAGRSAKAAQAADQGDEGRAGSATHLR